MKIECVRIYTHILFADVDKDLVTLRKAMENEALDEIDELQGDLDYIRDSLGNIKDYLDGVFTEVAKSENTSDEPSGE
jgi:hypothetical protein